jgi:hypothetical protein
MDDPSLPSQPVTGAELYRELSNSLWDKSAKVRSPEAAAVLRRVAAEYKRLAEFVEASAEKIQSRTTTPPLTRHP